MTSKCWVDWAESCEGPPVYLYHSEMFTRGKGVCLKHGMKCLRADFFHGIESYLTLGKEEIRLPADWKPKREVQKEVRRICPGRSVPYLVVR